jgi:sec-independent protein translocase protein TatB
MMKRMSFSETIFLFVLALIIFGPKKLPEIARQVGKVLNEFRRASNEFKAQIENEISHLEVEEKQKALKTSAPPEGTASRAPSTALSEPSSVQSNVPEASATAASPEAGEVPATLAAPSETPVVASHEIPPATEAQPMNGSESSNESQPNNETLSTSDQVTTASVASTTQESHA